jgi:hypothetical protein
VPNASKATPLARFALVIGLTTCTALIITYVHVPPDILVHSFF